MMFMEFLVYVILVLIIVAGGVLIAYGCLNAAYLWENRRRRK